MHYVGKLYPIPTNVLGTFDYKHERYYKTHKGYFVTHQATPYFYQDLNRGCVEKISAKEYLDSEKELKALFNESQNKIDKKVQMSLFDS